MPFTIGDIAAKIGGEVVGDSAAKITGVASADKARPGELTFAENEKYLAAAEASEAAGILVSGAVPKSAKALIKVANVRVAVAQLLPIFFPQIGRASCRDRGDIVGGAVLRWVRRLGV